MAFFYIIDYCYEKKLYTLNGECVADNFTLDLQIAPYLYGRNSDYKNLGLILTLDFDVISDRYDLSG